MWTDNDQAGGAPALHSAEQATRLRDDAIGSAEAADRDRFADRCPRLGARRICLPGRTAGFRLGGTAALDQRRRPRREAHAPSHGVARVYEAKVLGIPDDHDLRRMARGIVLEGRRTAPSTVLMRHGALVISVREGRNRQVRKMCEAIGHPVTHLKRIAIGPIRDPSLKTGQWRELSDTEVERLRKTADSPPPPKRTQRSRQAVDKSSISKP